MGVPSPPGRINTASWIMGQPLDFAPDSKRVYSNVGFLMLGLIIEQVSGMSHINYVRQNVFGPIDWMPVSEVVPGWTFPFNRDPREPWYDDDSQVQNVFNPDGDTVRKPAGGWHHEARIGQGGYVVSTTALLHLAETYYISDKQISNPTYGTLTNGVRENRWHNGSLAGTQSMLVQRTDGVNYAVLFNKRGTDVNSGQGYHFAIQSLINAQLNGGGIVWPTQGVDGQWVDLDTIVLGNGSFEQPWLNMPQALSFSPPEATVNIKPSSSSWTGIINQRIRIRAPLGTVTIGQ
jgi:CubicO group peptidase (beta-lactamase class C family)